MSELFLHLETVDQSLKPNDVSIILGLNKESLARQITHAQGDKEFTAQLLEYLRDD